MKQILFFLCLMFTQWAFSQTLAEKRVKTEMVDRVDVLLQKLEDSSEALKKEDPLKACSVLKDIFSIYPEHVKAIMGHMNLFEAKTVKAKDESLNHLIFIHRQNLICQQGKDAEYVDLSATLKELKSMEKSLKKQKKTILKSDTSYENTFYYQYEF